MLFNSVRLACLTSALFLTSAALGADAQSAPHIPGRKCSVAPKIDGVLAPGEWDVAAKVAGFVDPVSGAPASENTEVWLCYDDKAMFVAFYAHDRHPESLVGREIRAGADFNGEDTVTFRINPFGNRRYDGGNRFTVNLLNTQSEEIFGGRASKREWRGNWQSAVKKVADGYVVEMRIPWTIVSYNSGKQLPMDVLFERVQGRAQIGTQYPNTTQAGRPELRAVWEQIDPPERKVSRKPQVLAYLAPEYSAGKTDLRYGADVRAPLTDSVTGVLSLKPDFRNVENVVAGIDFVRTERFLDETRPFFSEGGGFLNLGGGFGYGRMLYTQRIGQFDIGAKAFGQINNRTGIGVLTTLASTSEERNVVAKVTETFGPFASASAFTTYHGEPGNYNQAFGAATNLRLGNYSFGIQGASEKGNKEKADTAGDLSIQYSVPRFGIFFRAIAVTPDFAPPLGFIPWTNRKGAYLFTEYSNELRKGPIRSLNTNIYATNFEQYDGSEQQKGADWYGSVTLRNDTRIGLSYNHTSYFDTLDLTRGIDVTWNNSNRFKRLSMSYSEGTQGGRSSRFVSIGTSRRLMRKLDVGFNYASQKNGDTVDRLSIGTFSYELDALRSLTGRVVQRGGDINAYAAYRNGGGNGTELYVILGDPNELKTVARLSIKLVWAF